MSPRHRYRQDLARGDFDGDAAQAEAIERAERLYRALLQAPTRVALPGWLRGRRSSKHWSGTTGLYLWGAVGRGKTYVMDLLYDCCPLQQKLRSHFHRFMQQVHREIKTLAATTDPLDAVAARLAGEARLLCLDELHVGDITDAMLLAGLFRSLFNRGVTLVATSNEPPDRLYWNGLQRERFLPAIEFIKQHTEVFQLGGDVDYRLRTLERAPIYHTPLDEEAARGLEACFERLAHGPGTPQCAVRIDGREIPTARNADGVVWFDFEIICGGPRGPSDYVEIALCYHSILIADIPCMDDRHNDKARRLITLVDALYDRNVKLVISAEAPPAALYCGEALAGAYRRTSSRLVEMQSHDYLAREHLP